MSFTVAAKNTMLNALTPDACSLHTAFPGLTGTNEVTGGTPAYARKAVAFAAAAGGSRALSAAVTFDVPATTVRWFGFWVAGTYVGYAANGGAQLLYVVDTGSNNIRSPVHGQANGTKVVFFNGTVPAPLAEGTVYFVVNATTDTFQVSATLGGAAIVLTGQPNNSALATIIEDVYAAQGSHTLSADSYGAIF
jgi:hypothetical protein